MDSNDILFIIIWILSILLIIHFSHKIITFVTENFESKTSYDEYTLSSPINSQTVVSTPAPQTTKNPNIHDEPNHICNVDDCPLASILSSYPTIGDKWGNDKGECVKVVNTKNATCARCPPGKFVDYSNVNGVCSDCPPGQYSDKYNSLSCKPCLNGTGDTCEKPPEEPDLFNPSLENDNKLSEIYKNNIQNYQQFTTLNDRLRRLNGIVDSLDSF